MLLLARLLTAQPQMEPQRLWSLAIQARQVSQVRREMKVITSLERREIRRRRTAGRLALQTESCV
jgi:hypothetical protein